MLSGCVALQDFIFAKEYRGMMGYKPGTHAPGLKVASWLFSTFFIFNIEINEF